ncbi:ABC transporter ATP-binding protein [Tenuibacillus multivorans]|uniref:ABC-type nitrate/sulfonate/bicarbonate transport system, ATPase component n=1 Tax=Tenuibacillus multivorans TaxID=237069 RepID=A0A1H0DU58_9BACI|nr:ABC transporter ATP-binding protein [Tenuibacillus multivorans]GEL76781.1 ABC transporter ATP-binding protein [Tenuibacillus multivorans]SDN73563.1 ABC-type nitrate/sulfonate/bicarbonate transport system, ATPase component [Tenuibacillus multivorans]
MEHLEIRDIQKSFGSNRVLDGVNFSTEKGEFVSLLGPSGSGKSTLFRMIGGISSPSSGDVLLEGNSIKNHPGSVSYTPQTPSLMPWRSILDNVLLGQEISGKKDEEMAAQMLERAGLSGFEQAYPHELSGGMKQRVSFIRSILSPQPLILLDEPFSALDEFTRTDMQKWLLSMWSEHQRSILFVTHNIEEAIFLSDRVIVLSQRPAKVIKEFEIPFERPRKEEILLSEEFLYMKKDIYQEMRSSHASANY